MADWQDLVVGEPGLAGITPDMSGSCLCSYSKRQLSKLLAVLFRGMATARVHAEPLVRFDFSVPGQMGLLFSKDATLARPQRYCVLYDDDEKHEYVCKPAACGIRTECESCKQVGGQIYHGREVSSCSLDTDGTKPITRAIEQIRKAVRELPYGVFLTHRAAGGKVAITILK